MARLHVGARRAQYPANKVTEAVPASAGPRKRLSLSVPGRLQRAAGFLIAAANRIGSTMHRLPFTWSACVPQVTR